MIAKKPSSPWKVVFLTDATPLPEQKFRSQKSAYMAVGNMCEQVMDGVSRVVRAVVYQWDVSSGRWMTFERHDLKKEAEFLRRVEDRLQADGKDDLAEKILDETLGKEK